jgi:Uma2 family endonuclease
MKRVWPRILHNRSVTGTEFDALPYEEGRRRELLDGELIDAPSPAPPHQIIASVVLLAIHKCLQTYPAKAIAVMSVELALSDDSRLRPDVCVLLPEKAGQLDFDLSPIPGAPDIAIEVISPTDRTVESHEKVHAFLKTGTAEVWQIYPDSRALEIYRNETTRSLTGDQQVITDLLPGFSAPLSSFFTA